MSRHRAEPARRRAARPRYGRLAVAGTSVAVTAIALLGGSGALSGLGLDSGPSSAAVREQAGVQPSAAPTTTATTPVATASAAASAAAADVSAVAAPAVVENPLPAGSGQGRRIVFSQGQQRVWLVGPKGSVLRTYPVSGSVLDNLDPGTYRVYSRSRWAVGIDDSGVMQYFVRFTQGPTGAAIGFHSIPTSNGKALQTKAQLGTPQSHGCIRQTQADAIALWDFAPLGTSVSVVAA